MHIAGSIGPGSGATPPLDPLLGTSIDGVTLNRRLGEGSSGVVYEGRQNRPSRLVAVKIMRSHTTTLELVNRFEYEAKILAQLNHPGIATIYKVGAVDIHGT